MSFMTVKLIMFNFYHFWLKKVLFNFLDTIVKNYQQKNSISK